MMVYKGILRYIDCRKKLFLPTSSRSPYINKQLWKAISIGGRLPLLPTGTGTPIILEILNRHFPWLRVMLDVSGNVGLIGWV